MEIFKDIPNYEGLYQVSDLGNVKSLKRKVLYMGSRSRVIKEKILKNITTNNDYSRVFLCKKGVVKTVSVHQLVAITFLGHKPNGYKLVCDHIDNDKFNNRLDNLQIISARENTSKDKKGGSSKYIGVYWDSEKRKWVSAISINNKRKYLGRFDKEKDASNAYKNKLNQLNQLKSE
jgi:hypothetical protein